VVKRKVRSWKKCAGGIKTRRIREDSWSEEKERNVEEKLKTRRRYIK
jgi:hypothetical protein